MSMQVYTLEQVIEAGGPQNELWVRQMAARADTTGLVVFRNEDFNSSQMGSVSIMVTGPGRTLTQPSEVEGRHLNDLPSQRQYPIAYWLKPKAEEKP